MTATEFLSTPLSLISAYKEAWVQQQSREDRRAALPAYITALANSGKGKKPKFEDFLIHKYGQEENRNRLD